MSWFRFQLTFKHINIKLWEEAKLSSQLREMRKTDLTIERSEEWSSWEWRRRREEKGESRSFHDFALFWRRKLVAIGHSIQNFTHPDERDSEGVESCSWVVKHLPPLVLTWDEEQEKAISAPDSCLDGSNLTLCCRNVILYSDWSNCIKWQIIVFVCHLNLGVFHCGWAVQQWQCTCKVLFLINWTNRVKTQEEISSKTEQLIIFLSDGQPSSFVTNLNEIKRKPETTQICKNC